jgi:hypothetical protein
MSDIPYSVRDGNVRVNTIRGFNFADINTNEMFKKVDDNNVGGTDIISTQTSTSNRLAMKAGGLELSEIRAEQDITNGGALQFFTKVDGGSVTEKLRINNIGAIGIGGATYGAAGSVLQSNGSGSSVSWRTPVILGASLSGAAYTGANPRTVVKYDNVEYDIPPCYEPTTGIFTAPRTAFYMVNAYARVTDFGAPFASRAQSFIYKKVGGVFTLYSATDVVDSQENYKGATPCTNIIIFLNSGEEIRHEVTFPSNTTYAYDIRGDAYEKRCSYLSIHSIT